MSAVIPSSEPQSPAPPQWARLLDLFCLLLIAIAAVVAGWLLAPDAVDLMSRVCAAKVRFGEAASPCPTYVPSA